MITNKLVTQNALNRTVVDQLIKIADKIKNYVTPDNFRYLLTDIIKEATDSSIVGKRYIDYSPNSSINSYQVKTIEDILDYLRYFQTETIVTSTHELTFSQITSQEHQIRVAAPEGYDGRNSFVNITKSAAGLDGFFIDEENTEVDNEFFTASTEGTYGLGLTKNKSEVVVTLYTNGDPTDNVYEDSEDIVVLKFTVRFWRRI